MNFIAYYQICFCIMILSVIVGFKDMKKKDPEIKFIMEEYPVLAFLTILITCAIFAPIYPLLILIAVFRNDN